MTADNKSPEPHFDEAFLLGKNSKNAVLGEVYHNVSFPFKKEQDSHGVDYWWFDSSKTTLAMQKDPSTGEYYLKNTGNQGWAKNVNSSGTTDINAGEYQIPMAFSRLTKALLRQAERIITMDLVQNWRLNSA
ncbi:MAG: hypothetical protein V8R94_08910 [Lachnospiraceae bacterium]